MGISRRMGLAISGMAFAGATVVTLGAAGPASAQAATVASQHSVTSPSIADKHRRWRNGGGSSYTYDYWEFWGGGCGCCC
jgi:hypothetical protein